jgi:hypothetical protein
MKKLLLLLGIVLCSLIAFSQNPIEQQLKSEIAYTQWIQQGPTQNCQPSFFWLVTRSYNQDAYGRSLFKIYFYSNSRYCNGEWAGTYIQGVFIIVDGEVLNPGAPYWILFKEVYQHPNFSFWAIGSPQISMNWTNLTVN